MTTRWTEFSRIVRQLSFGRSRRESGSSAGDGQCSYDHWVSCSRSEWQLRCRWRREDVAESDREYPLSHQHRPCLSKVDQRPSDAVTLLPPKLIPLRRLAVPAAKFVGSTCSLVAEPGSRDTAPEANRHQSLLKTVE